MSEIRESFTEFVITLNLCCRILLKNITMANQRKLMEKLIKVAKSVLEYQQTAAPNAVQELEFHVCYLDPVDNLLKVWGPQ